jgi:hypothetical protein
MRAFCAKHSAVKGISSISELEQQVRFTRGNKDKFVNDTTTTSSGSLNKTQKAEMAASPSMVGSTDNQEARSADMVVDQPTADGNLMSNSRDFFRGLTKVFIFSSYRSRLRYVCLVLTCILCLTDNTAS